MLDLQEEYEQRVQLEQEFQACTGMGCGKEQERTRMHKGFVQSRVLSRIRKRFLLYQERQLLGRMQGRLLFLRGMAGFLREQVQQKGKTA